MSFLPFPFLLFYKQAWKEEMFELRYKLFSLAGSRAIVTQHGLLT